MAKKQKTTQKFRIRLSGFDHRLLDQSTDNIVKYRQAFRGANIRPSAVAGSPPPL